MASGLCTGARLGLAQLLTTLYILRLGYGTEFLGVVLATRSISFASASLPSGMLGTRFGPRRMLTVGALIMIAGMAMQPLTEAVPIASRSIYILCGQVVASFGWCLFVVNSIATMASLTNADNRRGAYAVREAFSGLGSLVGAFGGGLLPGLFAGLLSITTAQSAPYRYALWGGVFLGICGLLPLALMHEVPNAPRSRTAKAKMRFPLPLAVLIGCAFFNNSAMSAARSFVPAYLDREFGVATSLIGTISSLGMLLAIVAALGSPRLARRWGSGYTMLAASLSISLSLLMMFLYPHWLTAAVGFIAIAAFAGLWRPGFHALQMEMADPAYRSLASGAAATAMSLGYGRMSVVGGYAVAALGYGPLFLLGTASAGMSASLMFLLLRAPRLRFTIRPEP